MVVGALWTFGARTSLKAGLPGRMIQWTNFHRTQEDTRIFLGPGITAAPPRSAIIAITWNGAAVNGSWVFFFCALPTLDFYAVGAWKRHVGDRSSVVGFSLSYRFRLPT